MSVQQQERREAPLLYLLDGEEGPVKDEILKSLIGELLPAEDRRLNLEIQDGRKVGLEEILSRAAILPFLAPCRLIVLKEADQLTSSDRERFVEYLKKSSSPQVCFILLTKKIDRKGSFFQSLRKIGKVIDSGVSSGPEIQDWLRERARKRGKTFAASALQALCELTGDDLNLLAGELEKIILLLGDRKEIGLDDVLALGGKRMHHIFRVIEALSQGKAEEAIEGMRSLLEYGEDPLKILGMISRHFRLLSLVKEMEGEGRSRGEMGRRFRIPAPYLQSLLSQSSSVSWGFLEKAFQDLLRADLFLKSEKGLGILTLERLIFDLSQICEPPLSQMDYGRKGEAKRCL